MLSRKGTGLALSRPAHSPDATCEYESPLDAVSTTLLTIILFDFSQRFVMYVAQSGLDLFTYNVAPYVMIGPSTSNCHIYFS